MIHVWGNTRRRQNVEVQSCRACGLSLRWIRTDDGVALEVSDDGVIWRPRHTAEALPGCRSAGGALVCNKKGCKRDAAPGRGFCLRHLEAARASMAAAKERRRGVGVRPSDRREA